MFKFIYKWLTETQARNYDMNIRDAINVIDRYDLWDNYFTSVKLKKLNHTEVEVVLGDGDCARFKRVKGDKTVYDLFFDNIHVHVSVSDTERIYSIRVKNPEHAWIVPFCDTDELPPDFGHPTTEYYEVYVWYIVPVLDITKAEGYVYKHGTWDKYVYKKMLSFFEDAKKETDASKFNVYYK